MGRVQQALIDKFAWGCISSAIDLLTGKKCEMSSSLQKDKWKGENKEEERYGYKSCFVFDIDFHPAGAQLKKKNGKVYLL